MKIAVMLRTLEENQGIGIYARNLMSSLLEVDRRNAYYFLYASKKQVGSFNGHGNLREVVINCQNKWLWDQCHVPLFAQKNGIDVVLNTKFSVPLATNSTTVMTLHGSEWYVYPEFYSRSDIFYNRLLLPFYCKKASAISCVSQVTADDIVKFARADPKKTVVVHSAMDSRFKPIRDEGVLNYYRNRYSLPERYVLFVGKLYPGKNFGSILKAFKKIRDTVGFPLKLVSVGDLRWKYEGDLDAIKELGLEHDVQFTGWVNQDALPAIYSLADVFLFPSIYEGFGIPILEAMRCGCPVVTATSGACPEVAGSAALFVDPQDVEGMASSVIEVLRDGALRHGMITRGFEQTKRFSWTKAAQQSLKIIENLRPK